MTNCYDEGTLRAYVDAALPDAQNAELSAHLQHCAPCKQRLAVLRAASQRVGAVLAAPVAPMPALERFRREHPAHHAPQLAATDQSFPVHTRRSSSMSNGLFSSSRRGVFAAALTLVIALSLLALPPVRAAADQLLQVFRVQTVMFLPINKDRLEQLRALNVDKDALFLSKPQVDNKQPPRSVASAADASQAVGATVAQATQFPSQPISTTYTVDSPHNVQFQVNPATLRTVLTQLNITDVTIPDALGSGPIRAAIPASAQTRYVGSDYELVLHQVHSPEVTLPDGVDLSQLGKAALRVLGMDEAQADAASKQINWNSTLIFPFPADASNIRQVTVGGAPALLMSGQRDGKSYGQIYWQQGDQIFMLMAHGSQRSDALNNVLLTAAESVR